MSVLPFPSSLAEARTQTERFESGGKMIRMETFSDSPSPDTPAILVLHGSTGVAFANRFIAGLASSFAQQGFVVYLLHYFDRTETNYADEAIIRRSFNDWSATVNDAIKVIRQKRPEAKVGIFGYSLGGYLAAAADVRNPQVAATVILSGGIDENSQRLAERTGPTLILHGEDDRRVLPAEARKLEKSLRSVGGKPEVHFYPGEGHIFSMPIYADIVARGTSFFQKNLRRGK
ncbi:MAG TPA: dienelactone hydrolase family protein [Chthoniobacterales bacterium]